VVAKSSPEEFQDFRIAQRFLTKERYVSMYVGIVIIEATPLVEAMMMPLIHNGAHKYQTYVDDALKFYRYPSEEDDSEDNDEQLGEIACLGHGPVWEFRKDGDWTAYELDDQILIESAHINGRKEITLQISTESYRLNWEGETKYQINEKTKGVRKIRRNPPSSTEEDSSRESLEESPDLIVRRKRRGIC